jgi:hypothetical protein
MVFASYFGRRVMISISWPWKRGASYVVFVTVMEEDNPYFSAISHKTPVSWLA